MRQNSVIVLLVIGLVAIANSQQTPSEQKPLYLPKSSLTAPTTRPSVTDVEYISANLIKAKAVSADVVFSKQLLVTDNAGRTRIVAWVDSSNTAQFSLLGLDGKETLSLVQQENGDSSVQLKRGEKRQTLLVMSEKLGGLIVKNTNHVLMAAELAEDTPQFSVGKGKALLFAEP